MNITARVMHGGSIYAFPVQEAACRPMLPIPPVYRIVLEKVINMSKKIDYKSFSDPNGNADESLEYQA